MPVVKWIQKDQRVSIGPDKTATMPSWKNWKQANTGRDSDITIVKNALNEIALCLDNATASDTTDLYLKNSTTSNNATFVKGINRLKIHVTDYIANTTNTRLFVAYQNVAALASSPSTRQNDLDLGSTKKSMNTIIIHNPFTLPYIVEGHSKTLSNCGRYMTVLHELTHSLLRTKDVWVNSTVYGISPPDPDNAVSTDDECKALAELALTNTLNTKYSPHLSWYNAENWARAIWSCHPTQAGASMYA